MIPITASANTDSVFYNLSRLFLPTDTDPSIPAETIASEPQPSEKKRRALVVDDVPDVTDMLSFILTHAGYDVITASSAMAALETAREHRFDVVISDIGMPKMNGYELAESLRKLEGYETIPMVAVTGFSMFNDREKSLQAGFNVHLTKPIDPRKLLDLLDQL